MSDFDRVLKRWPRSVHVWRTVGRGGIDGVLRYGVLYKPGVRDDVVDRSIAYYGVVYVLRGKGTYYDGAGGSWPMEAGTLFQRLPNRRHSTILDPDSDWAELYLCFTGQLARVLNDLGVIDAKRPVIERGIDPDLAERMLSGLVSLRAASDDDLPFQFCHAVALLGDLLRAPASRADPDRRLVAAACARLGDDLAQPCSPRQLARELGCGYERFRKLFQHRTGLSPARWRMRRRMERARELLLDRTLSVARIGELVGFADPTLFATRFRKHCGVSPRRFRSGAGGASG